MVTRAKLFWGKKNFLVKKFLGQKIFRVKKFFGLKKIFGSKNFSDQKFFGSKKFLGLKNFWVRKFFGSENFRVKNFSGRNFGQNCGQGAPQMWPDAGLMLYSAGCCLLSAIGTFPGGGGVKYHCDNKANLGGSLA